ncbi:hypothetical protein K9N68_34530 (plasmid) [Kovacikia minuta CCNUW1]|uniref:hypothetical protein n=1 Tax=Kovacikia minuta TaxID=2931930 RepID=UPI001CCC5617|nr:hypothetical protein [Kovacikia minuta]UBF30328.1 hypothetical protein K9N68_34530 [Kovacikia minuta CCNUW1]
MPTKRPSERSTKTELLSAFDQLLQEKKALEAQLEIASQLEPPRNGKTATIAPPPSAPEPPPDPAPNQKMESIIEGLNRLQLNFGGAVSDLSEKLTLEVFQLQEVQQSVAEEVQQLETLHGLQAAETNLDTLIQEYEASAKTFNEELRQRQDAIDQEMTQAKKTWAKEQEDQRRLIKERHETFAKTRQRDTKEYTYDLTLLRKLADDEYEQERKRLYQELEELQQTQAKQLAEREKTIADRENQFTELKAKVEAFPKDLEAAIKRAKEEGKGIANQQAKVKADLLAKEIEGSKRTYELRLDSLEETIEDQQTRLQNLAKQLDAALKQVQDLAVKAIEGASDVSSYQAIKEIALEQAKNLNKNK